MALQINTTLKIGGKIIGNFTNLIIDQKIHEHNTFSLKVRKDLLVEELRSVMPASLDLSGQRISIEVKPIPNLDDLMVIASPQDYIMRFYGVVTEVMSVKSTINTVEETILITGFGTSKLLDSGPNLNSFLKMPIADIVDKVKSGYEIDMDVYPFYKNNLAYTVQYNQSDFDFLNMMAKRKGQWFYDNGRKVIFGSPGSTGAEPKLVYGINMQHFSYKITLNPTLFKTIENDNREGEYFEDYTEKYRKEADGFQQNFINKSNDVFNKVSLIHVNQNPAEGNVRNSVEQYTTNKMRAVVGGLMEINAMSEVPGVILGDNVRISGVDMQHEGSYRVTQITHFCDDGGSYKNDFTAVNFNGAVFSPLTNPDLFPYCPSQSAIVVDNTDPEGLSCIAVQMPWQIAKGESTPFVPIIQQYSGDGKGAHVLPEIGEAVYVEFQGGNAEMPIVLGTLTSRKEKSGYSTPNNDLKVFRTRAGITTIYNDAEGSALTEDASGTQIFMDGKGNAKLLAKKNIEIQAGEDIIMNAGNNIITNAGMNIEESAGGHKKSIITLYYDLSIGTNFILNVIGNMFEWIKGNKEIESTEIKEMAGEISISSTEESISMLGAKNVNNHSGESSRNG
ncbi:type IV secretion protein Rhs [Flavobacterium psychroterrae]|uniref:Type IV secretion protein Rhs n=1 Tax=Flavobacterium psychroterrae TaxID=2133767 RepID=A0ABS5P9K5_9FLAO|nr:phage baseplate assembly protein V [Flavobacterium psychroterrae]MBS7230988.1 type IV secretion protein Rhs [Flavobacterium psychroterrae]